MPKRSNLFQEVVALLQGILAPGCTVTESAELQDLITGANREVDVCVDGELGGHRVLISIECRDQARRQTVEWVEQAIQKHSRLPTNLLILISSSGFSEEAHSVAAKSKVELVQPGRLAPDLRARFVANLDSLWIKTIRASTRNFTVGVDAPGTAELALVDLEPSHLIYNSDKVETTAVEAAQELLDWAIQGQMASLLRDATGEEQYLTVELDLDGEGSRMYLSYTGSGEEVLTTIRTVRIVANVVVEVAEVPLDFAQMLGAQYAYGTASTPSASYTVVTATLDRAQPGAPPSFAIKVKPAKR